MVAKSPAGSFHRGRNHDGSSVQICAKTLHARLPKDNKTSWGPENPVEMLHLRLTFVSYTTLGALMDYLMLMVMMILMLKKEERGMFHIGDFKPWHVAQGTR